MAGRSTGRNEPGRYGRWRDRSDSTVDPNAEQERLGDDGHDRSVEGCEQEPGQLQSTLVDHVRAYGRRPVHPRVEGLPAVGTKRPPGAGRCQILGADVFEREGAFTAVYISVRELGSSRSTTKLSRLDPCGRITCTN
jgi:hypothetical protein